MLRAGRAAGDLAAGGRGALRASGRRRRSTAAATDFTRICPIDSTAPGEVSAASSLLSTARLARFTGVTVSSSMRSSAAAISACSAYHHPVPVGLGRQNVDDRSGGLDRADVGRHKALSLFSRATRRRTRGGSPAGTPSSSRCNCAGASGPVPPSAGSSPAAGMEGLDWRGQSVSGVDGAADVGACAGGLRTRGIPMGSSSCATGPIVGAGDAACAAVALGRRWSRDRRARSGPR